MSGRCPECDTHFEDYSCCPHCHESLIPDYEPGVLERPICKTCDHFNFKVSAEYSYGECLNSHVQAAQHISLSRVSEVFNHPDVERLLNAIDSCARIYYREDMFGCRFHSDFPALSH